jgi:hypothetical protein
MTPWIVRAWYRGPIDPIRDMTIDTIGTGAGLEKIEDEYSRNIRGRWTRSFWFVAPSRAVAEDTVASLYRAGIRKADAIPGRDAPEHEIADWDWRRGAPIANPLNLSLENKKRLMIGAGVIGFAAIGYAIYSAMKAAPVSSGGGGAIVTTTPVTGGGSSSGGSSGGGTTSVGPVTSVVTVTAADAGKTFSMNVGDTLNVVLPVTATVAGYDVDTSTPSGPNILAGSSAANASGQTTMSYTATATGSETLSFYSTDLTGSIDYTIPAYIYTINVGPAVA